MRIPSGRTVPTVLAALAIAAFVGACSDTVSDEATEDLLARCEPVAQETVDLIATGLTISNGVLSTASAVKSDYGPTLWIVAAQVNGDDFEGNRFIGNWAVVDGIAVEEVEALAAVDDFTRDISTWGDDLGNDISSGIDGVAAATACVQVSQES